METNWILAKKHTKAKLKKLLRILDLLDKIDTNDLAITTAQESVSESICKLAGEMRKYAELLRPEIKRFNRMIDLESAKEKIDAKIDKLRR